MEPSTGMQSDRARVILEGGGVGNIFEKWTQNCAF